MMKRALSLLLALATLVCCFGTSASAVMIGGGAGAVTVYTSDSDDRVTAVTAIGGSLYLLHQGGLLTTRPVDKNEELVLGEVMNTQGYSEAPEPDEEGQARLDRLFAWQGEPYGLCTAAGEVWRLLDEGGAFAPVRLEGPALDTSSLNREVPGEDYSYTAELNSFFCQGDWLYYTGLLYGEGMPASVAGRISLTTGQKQDFACPKLSALAPAGDGQIMALLYDRTAAYSVSGSDDITALAQYGAFDPEKDAVASPADIPTDSAMGGYTISGVCYGNGTLYYRDGSRVMGLDAATGKTRISAYTGEGMYGSMNDYANLYVDGYYVSCSYDGLSVLKLDSESLKNGALTIFGEFGTDAHKSFLKNYPDISVDVSGEYTNDIERLTQAMVSDGETFDVLLLSMGSMPVERLMQKGYCADLSVDKELMDIANQMYPSLLEPLTQDGKLYAVPVGLYGNCYGVNMEKWEELGLTQDDLPKTLGELYDFIANWVYDYGEDHPDIALFDYSQANMMLYSLLVNDYIAYMQKRGEGLRFDTPVFRGLLESFGAIDFDEIASNQGDEGDYWHNDALFSTTMSVGYLNRMASAEYKPLYLAMEPGEEPFVAMTMQVLAVNPRTKRMTEAMLYVKNYLNNLERTSANITLFPGHNDPVENSYYEKNRQEIQKSIENAQKRLETASEENRAEIEEELKWLNESLESWEEYRYDVTAEQIAQFREEVAPIMHITGQSVFINADASASIEANKLLMQYMEGAIGLDQLVKELDQRVKLMELEDR